MFKNKVMYVHMFCNHCSHSNLFKLRKQLFNNNYILKCNKCKKKYVYVKRFDKWKDVYLSIKKINLDGEKNEKSRMYKQI